MSSNPISSEDFEQLLALERNKEQADGWSLSKRIDGCEIWVRSIKEDPSNLVKAFHEFPGISSKVLGTMLMEPSVRLRFDPALSVMEKFEEHDDFCLMYTSMKVPVPFASDRDFVFARAVRKTDAETLACHKEVTSSARPEVSGKVRGSSYTGFILREKPGDPTSSTLTHLIRADYKGNFPLSAVNGKMAAFPPNFRGRLTDFYENTYKAELEAAK